MKRGCSLASMCNLCNNSIDSSFHLFLSCPYAVNLWNWLSCIIQCPLNLSSLASLLSVLDRNWSTQIKDRCSAGCHYFNNLVGLEQSKLEQV